MPSKMPPAHPHCRCRIVSFIEEIEEPYPVVVEPAIPPKSLEETAILQELTTELKALRPEEITARIRAHLGSDWRRNPDGTFDAKASRLKAEFEKHAKDLNVQSLKEYEQLSYEVIRKPEYVFIQRVFNPQTKKYETNYIFVRNGVYVVSNDESLAIQTAGRLKEDIESWLSELSKASPSATVKLLGTRQVQPRPPQAFIDKYEFRSIQDVEKLVIDFAETHKDLFFYTATKVVVKEGANYNMACVGYSDRTGTIFINKKYEGMLITALQNLRNKVPLTIEDEKILSTLWHEFTHLRTINLFKTLRHFTDYHRWLMETLTEFIARHTYDRFLSMLRPGIKPNHLREVIEDGMGYQAFIERFRFLLKTFRINEKEAVKELEAILFEKVDNISVRLVEWLGTKIDISEPARYNILADVVELDKVNFKDFKKEVKRLYESAKRRQ
jgi:hypothetical protein